MKKITSLSNLRPLALGATTLSLGLALAGCNGSGGGGATSGETLATVGNTTISRADLGRFLEANSGAQALPYLIDTALLKEEANSKGITVSDEEVTADLARRQTGDPAIEAQLKDNPLLAGVIKDQIRRDLTVQRLLTSDVKIDDAKVKKFFDTYRSYYDVPGRVKIGLLMTSTKQRADALERSLKGGKTFAALVAEQKKAQDPIAQNSSEDRGNLEAMENFEPKLRAALEKAPIGGTTPVQTITVGPGQTIYAIFRVIERQAAKKADLTSLKSTLETDAKMMEVAIGEIKKNPQNPQKVEDNLRAVAGQLSQGNPSSKPAMRDILSYILRPAAETRLAALRTSGTVSVSDPNYTKVGTQYQAAPAAGAAGTASPGGTSGGAPAASGTKAP